MTARTWFITGASRGIGLEVARAALAAGHRVVATARRPEGIAEALDAPGGTPGGTLLALPLDVTDADAARAAVARAEAELGGVDVLFNNAGYGQFGAFEEVSHALIERQMATNLHGAMHVTRAALPGMRARGHGRVLNMSSIAGLSASAGAGAYNASKFALEGWSEALGLDLAPFGIRVTLIEPGFFRTDFLDGSSARWGDVAIDAYAESRDRQAAVLGARNHAQPGDPGRLAALILAVAEAENPPVRLLAGTDALGRLRDRLASLTREADTWEAMSASTDFAE